jgi:hypothetical protein
MEVVTMRRISFFTVAMVLIAGLVFASGMNLFAHYEGFNFEEKQSTVSGTVSFKRPGGYFLETDSGKEYKLAMGPVWHLENMGLELKVRDRIMVTGFKGEDEVILVTSIEKGGKTYELAESDDPDDFYPGYGYGMGQGRMYDRGYGGYDAHHHRMMRGSRGWYGRRMRGCW